jgi:hypothetical protein
MDKLTPVVVILVLLVALTVGPLVTLWMLNTLFALALPFTFKTWLAALVFNLLVAARTK